VLRRLADEGVPGASPADWWGLAPLSDDAPLVPDGEAVRVRPSAIETFQRCPLKWVLGAVGAEASPDATRTVGSAVHAVAQQVAEGLPAAEAPAALAEELDQLDLGPGWSDQRQRAPRQEMLDRFLRWHAANGASWSPPRRTSTSPSAGPGCAARSTGWSATRRAGWSSSTSRPARPRRRTSRAHGQLAAYQVAVAAGGFGDHGTVPGGAALLQVGTGAKAKEQHQEPLPADVPAVADLGRRADRRGRRGHGRGAFEVRTGPHCRAARPGAAARCTSAAGR
jgi:hypothetical protein